MPIKDKEKAREYKRLWIAQKRSRQKDVEPRHVEPNQNNFVEPVELSKCSHCEFWKNEISGFANLYRQEQDETKKQKRINQQLEKKVKELELKIISLQETNQILRKDLGYWQEK